MKHHYRVTIKLKSDRFYRIVSRFDAMNMQNAIENFKAIHLNKIMETNNNNNNTFSNDLEICFIEQIDEIYKLSPQIIERSENIVEFLC